MSYNKEDLISYRLEKAYESLEEADILAEMRHWNTVANRLYYACFYAITAYLAKMDNHAITHKGIKSAFHQELVKAGILDIELGRFYSDIFNKRQEADYKDFVQFDESTIKPLIEEAKIFVEEIKKITST